VLQGVSVDGAAGAHHGEVALVHGRVTGEDGERAPAWWGTAAWERTTGFGRWGAALVRSGGRWAGGASVDATIGPGTWSTEWSRAAAGYAAGTAVSLAAGSVRVRGELSHVGAGYRIPGIRQVRDARGVESVRYGVEGRWQRERGRFLRLLVHGEREPAAGDAPWPRTAGVQEVELGERLRARLHLGLLWRLTIRNADAVDTQDQLVRSDLIYRGRGWRVRFRVERKAAGEAYALASLRAGWTGRIPWEVAIDRVSGTGAVPWVHRRRAGVLYGWDRMAAGTWIGGWIRIPASRWEGELSVYGRHTGWDLALALRMAFGLP
jgi:hypothetical protein